MDINFFAIPASHPIYPPAMHSLTFRALLCLNVFAALFFGRLVAQQPTDFRMFDGEEPLKVTIRTEMKTLMKADTSYVKADFILKTASGEMMIPVRLKARGAFRKDFCSMPPLRMKLDQERMKDSTLKKVMNVKLVTQCKPVKVYDTYLLTEFLAYKLYEKSNPYHFRTRLMEVEWVDVSRPDKAPVLQHAFAIEDIDQLAARMGCRVIETPAIRYQDLNRKELIHFSLFQYMIGNTDWNVRVQHNLKLLQPLDESFPPLIPVPYDFDYCGLVNASYAIPALELEIKSVRERLFLGPCMEEDETVAALSMFKIWKEPFLEIVRTYPYLPAADLRIAENYLLRFFELADSPPAFYRRINGECLKSPK